MISIKCNYIKLSLSSLASIRMISLPYFYIDQFLLNYSIIILFHSIEIFITQTTIIKQPLLISVITKKNQIKLNLIKSYSIIKSISPSPSSLIKCQQKRSFFNNTSNYNLIKINKNYQKNRLTIVNYNLLLTKIMAILTATIATTIISLTEASFYNRNRLDNIQYEYQKRDIISSSLSSLSSQSVAAAASAIASATAAEVAATSSASSSSSSRIAERALLSSTSTITQAAATSKNGSNIVNSVKTAASASSSSQSSAVSSVALTPSAYSSTAHCPTTYPNLTLPETDIYCNWTWDKFLCWPPTEPGKIVRLPCPSGHGIDITKFAERRCGWDGRWEGKPGSLLLPQDTSSGAAAAAATATAGPGNSYMNGWTNYTPCYTPEILELMKKVYAGGNGDIVKIKFDIVERTRTLEIIGLMLSLCALLLSLIIFCNFRSLRNNRTKIHKNLFIAMVIQVLIRLTLYLDQAIIRRGHEIAGNGNMNGIENTPYLCEASYILLEYARTAMFMWMFIEGLYLHNVITVTVFQGRFPHTLYVIIGWGGPILMTAIWAFFTARYKGQEKCWWNYNLTPYYWILEGPRLAVILFNFFFLLNIIRVLIVKLRQSHTSDVEQVRKAVRAAVVLLPLLGITNLLHMTEAPLDKTAWEFALWSYVTYFLRSFQGLFIAMIYCFLNGEVRAALMKSLSVYMSIHGHPNWAPRRASMFSAAYNTAPETEGHESTHRRESSTNRTAQGSSSYNIRSRRWMMTLCFRGQKVLREPPVSSLPPETNV